MSVQVYSLFDQTEREKKAFFGGCKKGGRGGTLRDYLKGHLVVIRQERVSPFVKFKVILPLLCFLLDPLTNKKFYGVGVL